MVSPFANATLNRIAGNTANLSMVCDGLSYNIVQSFLCLTGIPQSDCLQGMSLSNNTSRDHNLHRPDLHGTDLHGGHLQGNNLRRKLLGLLGIQLAYQPTAMQHTAAGTALNCTVLQWIGLIEFQGIRVFVGDSDRHRRSGIIGWIPIFLTPFPS